MNEKILKQHIDRFDISCETIELLKDNQITVIDQICKKSKKELQDLGISNNEIEQIKEELRLEGLSLNLIY